jgi:hypothetical protein
VAVVGGEAVACAALPVWRILESQGKREVGQLMRECSLENSQLFEVLRVMEGYGLIHVRPQQQRGRLNA